jgi:hypothetical protein
MTQLEECMGGKLPGFAFNLDAFEAECTAADEEYAAALAALSGGNKLQNKVSVGGCGWMAVGHY